jgi:hypothetical protein
LIEVLEVPGPEGVARRVKDAVPRGVLFQVVRKMPDFLSGLLLFWKIHQQRLAA